MLFQFRNAFILSVLLHAGMLLFFVRPPSTTLLGHKDFSITVYLRSAAGPPAGSLEPALRNKVSPTTSSTISSSPAPSSSSSSSSLDAKGAGASSLNPSSTVSDRKLNPRTWSAEKPVDEILRLSPFLQEIANRLAAHTDYNQELVRDDMEGSVLVYAEVNAKGVLQRMTLASGDGPSALRAMTVENVRKALNTPMQRTAPVRLVQLTVRVNYSITHPRNARPIVPLRIDGNEIAISKQVVKAAMFDITEQSLDDSIFTRIFKKKKPSLRESWDLSQRTDRLVQACEIERVEEVCMKAGENLVLLDRLNEATRLFQSLCDEGKTAACKILQKIKVLP